VALEFRNLQVGVGEHLKRRSTGGVFAPRRDLQAGHIRYVVQPGRSHLQVVDLQRQNAPYNIGEGLLCTSLSCTGERGWRPPGADLADLVAGFRSQVGGQRNWPVEPSLVRGLSKSHEAFHELCRDLGRRGTR
jgi:hypothetical protein